MGNFLSLIAYVKDRGFFDLLTINYLTQVLGFGSTLLVAKFLTPVELGEVKIIQSYIAIFVIFAGFGFNSAVLKACSEALPEMEKAGILRLAVRRSLAATAVILILVMGLAFSGVMTTSARISFWLVVYSLTIPSSVLTSLFIVYLQAKKKIRAMARSQAVIKAQSVVLVVISTWLWGFNGFLIATVVAFTIGVIPLLRQVGLNFLKTSLASEPSYFNRYALVSVVANGVNIIGERGDLLLLDHFTSNREAIGYYSLAVIFLMAASQVTSTVQSIATPYLSERAKDKVWFREQLIRNQLRAAMLSIPVAGAIYVLAWFLVPLVYGPAFTTTLTYLAILLLKYVAWSSYAIFGIGLFSLGLIHYNMIIAFITTSLSLGLSYLFLQKFGIVGMAWGQVGSAVLGLSIYILVVSFMLKRGYFEHHVMKIN